MHNIKVGMVVRINTAKSKSKYIRAFNGAYAQVIGRNTDKFTVSVFFNGTTSFLSLPASMLYGI
jgi:ribosomal protein L21E